MTPIDRPAKLATDRDPLDLRITRARPAKSRRLGLSKSVPPWFAATRDARAGVISGDPDQLPVPGDREEADAIRPIWLLREKETCLNACANELLAFQGFAAELAARIETARAVLGVLRQELAVADAEVARAVALPAPTAETAVRRITEQSAEALLVQARREREHASRIERERAKVAGLQRDIAEQERVVAHLTAVIRTAWDICLTRIEEHRAFSSRRAAIYVRQFVRVHPLSDRVTAVLRPLVSMELPEWATQCPWIDSAPIAAASPETVR